MARYALVIGIAANDASLGTLSHPLADAGAIAQVLTTYGDFRVEVLTQPEETTARAIAVKLQEFFLVRSLRQEALLFFSGHGFPVVDEFGEVEAFLAPSDCVVEWGVDAKGKTSAIAQRNGLALRSVSALAARAELSNLVMLLDCCHSGYLLEEALLKQTFAAFIQKDYWLMTACRSFESAWAKNSERYSLFTGAVLAGLAIDRADELGAISIGELFAFIPKALKGEPQEVMQLAIGRPIELVRYPLETVAKWIELLGSPGNSVATEKTFSGDPYIYVNTRVRSHAMNWHNTNVVILQHGQIHVVIQELRKELIAAQDIRDLRILKMNVCSILERVRESNDRILINEIHSLIHDIERAIKYEDLSDLSRPAQSLTFHYHNLSTSRINVILVLVVAFMLVVIFLIYKMIKG